MGQSIWVGVDVRGLSLQFQHMFLTVPCYAFWVNAWNHMTLGMYKEKEIDEGDEKV